MSVYIACVCGHCQDLPDTYVGWQGACPRCGQFVAAHFGQQMLKASWGGSNVAAPLTRVAKGTEVNWLKWTAILGGASGAAVIVGLAIGLFLVRPTTRGEQTSSAENSVVSEQWQRIEDRDAGFAFSTPGGSPQRTAKETPNDRLITRSVSHRWATSAPDCFWRVTRTFNSSAMAERFAQNPRLMLMEILDSNLNAFEDARELGRREFQWKGCPAVEVTLEVPPTGDGNLPRRILIFRFLIVGNSDFYLAQFVAVDNYNAHRAKLDRDRERFFESLEVF